MDEARLRGLQFLQGALGGVARGADLDLCTLSLGDRGVIDYKAAAGHRIPAHLDDAPVGPRVLGAQFLADRLKAATQLRLDVGIAKFAAPGEKADVVGVGRPLSE